MIEILPMKDREQERKILDGIDCAGPQARVRPSRFRRP